MTHDLRLVYMIYTLYYVCLLFICTYYIVCRNSYKVSAFCNVHFYPTMYEVFTFCILNNGLYKVTVWRLPFIIMFNINGLTGCCSWCNNVRYNICVKVYLKNIIFFFLTIYIVELQR